MVVKPNSFSPDNELLKIVYDRLSGSSEITTSLHSYFINHAEYINNHELLNFLIKELNHFQHTVRYIEELKKFKPPSNPTDFLLSLKQYFQSFDEATIKRLKQTINKSVLTFSNSGTIKKIIYKLAEDLPSLEVIVSESRPLCEGKILAQELLQKNIKVSFITEAQLPGYIKSIDAAIIGCDGILENGNILNKVGSLSIAILCKHFSKPLFVIAQKAKQLKSNTVPLKKENPKEIWDQDHVKLSINNIYFEIIDKSLFKILY